MAYNLNTTFKDVLKIISLGIMTSISSVSGNAFSMDDREEGHSSRQVLSSQAETDAEFSEGALIGLSPKEFPVLSIRNWTEEEVKTSPFKVAIFHQANLAFVYLRPQTNHGRLRELEIIYYNNKIILELSPFDFAKLEREISELKSRGGKSVAHRTWIRNMIPSVILEVKTKNKGPGVDRKIEEIVTHLFRIIAPFEGPLVDGRDVIPGKDIIWND